MSYSIVQICHRKATKIHYVLRFLNSLSVATRWQFVFILLSQLTCWVLVLVCFLVFFWCCVFFLLSMIYTSTVLNGAIQPVLAVHTSSIKPDLAALLS